MHHIGWSVLSDMGGIYTLGPSQGTVIRNNIFHDIYSYSYGGWGLYTDEGSTGIVMENNLVYNVKTGGFHQHYGKENVVRNNILAFSKLYQVQATRVEDHLTFTFENNIVYYNEGALLSGPWTKVRIKMDKNCYWDAGGRDVTFAGKKLEDWRKETGHDKNSIIADPKFVAPGKNDFRFHRNNQAIAEIGFKPFDYTKAGVYGDSEWIKKAKEVTYPPLEIAPDPPPVSIRDDFEGTAVGAKPAGTQVHVEKKGDSIADTNNIYYYNNSGQGLYDYNAASFAKAASLVSFRCFARTLRIFAFCSAYFRSSARFVVSKGSFARSKSSSRRPLLLKKKQYFKSRERTIRPPGRSQKPYPIRSFPRPSIMGRKLRPCTVFGIGRCR